MSDTQDLTFNFDFKDKGLLSALKDITNKCNRLYATTHKGNEESNASFNKLGLQIEKNAEKVSKLEDKYSELAKEQKELETAKINTKVYDEALAKAEELESEWSKLNKKILDFDATGNTEEHLDELKDKADSLRAYIEKTQSTISDNLTKMSPEQLVSATETLNKYKQELKDTEAEIKNLESPKSKQERDRFMVMRKQLFSLEEQIDEANGKVIALEEADKAFMSGKETPRYTKIAEEMTDVSRKIKEAKIQEDELIRKQAKVGESIRKSAFKWDAYKKGIKDISSRVGKLALGIKTGLSNAFKSASSVASKFFNKTGKDSNNLLKRIGTLALGITGITVALNAIRRGASEGFTHLANYSKSTANQIQSLRNSLAQLKNALATAFQPILAVVVPVLQTLIGYLIQAANAIASFFAAFTGQKTVYKATQIQQGYNDSLGNTSKKAKEANKQLGEYDNLMVIQQQDTADAGAGAGAGGVTDPLAQFEEVPVDERIASLVDRIKEAWKNADFTDLGEELAHKIADMLNSIPWDKVKEFANKFAKSLATFLNGLIDPELLIAIGNTVAEALNTGFGAIKTFADNFEWEENGKTIAQGINAFVEKIDPELIANALGGILVGFKDFAKGLLKEIDWNSITEKLKTFASTLTGFLNDILTDKDFWNTVATTISNAVNAITAAVKELITGIEWKDAGKTIGGALIDMFTNIKWDEVATNISDAAKGLLNLVIGAVEELDKKADKVGQSIVDFFTNIDWVGIFVKATELVTKLAKAIGKVLLNVVKDKDFQDTVLELGTAIMVAIGTAMMAKSAMTKFTAALSGIGSAIVSFITADIGVLIAEGSVATIGATIAGAVAGGFIAAIGGYKLGNKIYDSLETDENGDNAIDRFVAKVGDGVQKAWKKLKDWNEIGGEIVAGLLEGVEQKFKDDLNWWKEHLIDPIVNKVKELLGIHSPSIVFKEIGGYIIDGLFAGISDGVKNVKEWLDKNVISKIEEGWDKLKDVTVTIKGKIDETFDKLKGAWEDLKDKDILSKAKGKIEDTFKTLKEKWDDVKDKNPLATAKGKIEDTFSKLKEKWDAVKNKDPLATAKGELTKSFNSLKEKWDDLKSKKPVVTTERAGLTDNKLDKLKSKWNAIDNKTATLTLKASAAVQEVKGWINKNLIDKLNAKLKATKLFSKIHIPPLAEGAVIPPNKEFLAILGDQKSGTNIETPLSTMKQAFLEALKEGGYTNSDNNTNQQPIVLQIDGREMAKVVWDEQEKRYKQLGRYTPIFS